MSALYLLVLLPAVHSFEMFMLVCAPLFLVLGVLLARPATFGRAMPFLFGICGTPATTVGPVDDHVVNLPQRQPVTMLTARAQKVIGVPLDDALDAEMDDMLEYGVGRENSRRPT